MGARAGHRLLRATGVALLLVALAGSGAVAQVADPDALPGRLQVAERRLAEVESVLRRAARALDTVDERLATATARKHAVADELAAAEAALAGTRRRQEKAARYLAAANAAMRDRLDEFEQSRAAVNDRVAEVYKRGRAAPADLLFGGVARSTDLHEATVAVRTVQGLLSRDRELLEQNRALTVAANDARAEVSHVRDTARRDERAAARERRRVEALLQQQERLVASIEDERGTRARIVAAIEADRTATAVLVDQLAQRLRTRALPVQQVLRASHPPAQGPPPAWAGLLPAAGREWAPTVVSVAAQQGVDARLLAALVWTESHFTPTAVSHAGAVGLAQLMPATAAGMGVDPWDAVENLAGGARYLRAQVLRFGSVELGLAAYNAGPARVLAAGGIPAITETRLYVVRVLDRYERLSAAG